MATGLPYELLIEGVLHSRVEDLKDFEPPEGDWVLQPAVHLGAAELCSLVVHDARAHKLTRLSLVGLCDDSALPLGALPPLELLRIEAPLLTAAGLEPLSDQRGLRHLALIDTSVERLELLERTRALRHFELRQAQLAPGATAPLAALTELEHLSLDKLGLGAADLAPLASLQALESLSLVGCHPGPAGLSFLRRLSRLRTLDLSWGPSLDDEGLAPLAALEALEALSLAGRPGIRGEGLRYLAGLEGLLRLDLSGTGLMHEGLRHLAGLRQLEKLSLARTPLWDLDGLRARLEARGDVADRMLIADAWPTRYSFRWEDPHGEDFPVDEPSEEVGDEVVLEAFSAEDLVPVEDDLSPGTRVARLMESAAVYEVSLHGLLAPLSGLRALDGLPALRQLDLRHTPVREADLAGLSWPALQQLDLADSGVVSLAGIGPLPSLRALDLIGVRPTGALLRSLSGLQGLEGLRLSGGALTAEALEALVSLPALSSLTLMEAELVGGALAPLAGLGALRRLSLHGAKLQDAGLDALARAPSLEALDLSRCALRAPDLAAIPSLTSLRHLDLTRTAVTDAQVLPLARSTRLRWLGLAFTQVSREATRALAEALPWATVTRSFLPEEDD